MFWNISRIYQLFLSYKTFRATVTLIFSNFFLSSFSDRTIILSQLYLFIKYLIFVILCRSFLISSLFNATVKEDGKHWWDFLLLFCFLSNQENLHMIHYHSHLFYGIYNIINSLPFTDSKLFWYLSLSESKSSYITSAA